MESSDARRANRAAVLGTLLAGGAASRIAVAQATGLSKATVTRVVDELVRDGLVREAGPLAGGERGRGPGRQALALRLAGEDRAVCGVDLGGTTTRFLVTDAAGRVRAWHREPTPHETTTSELAGWLASRVRELAGDDLVATSVGLPGAVHPATGAVRTAPNLPQLEGTAFRHALAADLPGTTLLGNDVNAALVGEMTAGAARGRGSVVMIAAGTGLGAAVALDGRPLTGRTGSVGEFGVLRHGPGTLEDAISGGGMVRRARALGHPVPDAARIFAEGAPRAVLDEAREALATLLTAVTVAYEPEVVVLSGGVAPSFAPWLDGLRERLADVTEPPPELRPSALGEPGGAVGAWVTALHALYRDLDVDQPDLGGVAASVLDHLDREGSHVPAPSA
ncbi:ROK family transcriptional regulator [Actinomadura rupiterrae]|uniref:ROK family transcriptional regulator n=1 Tax=Actinomadura rupiterrae TaxID=559627 RepID=UPI0020A5820F|nr:ROK family transcriptional regulator [Actinomadura rupiterrae]MCP2338322.1 putative NBD/HSP70 family sugar kinase [Actinomadura rupiterrae]